MPPLKNIAILLNPMSPQPQSCGLLPMPPKRLRVLARAKPPVPALPKRRRKLAGTKAPPRLPEPVAPVRKMKLTVADACLSTSLSPRLARAPPLVDQALGAALEIQPNDDTGSDNDSSEASAGGGPLVQRRTAQRG